MENKRRNAKSFSKPIRSKKHNKIKPNDPFFSKKGRPVGYINKQETEYLKYNRPPTKPDDQEIPKSLKALINYKKQAAIPQKSNDTRKGKRRAKLYTNGYKGWNFSEREEALEKGMTRPLKDHPQFVRMKNESVRQFMFRVEEETARAIQKSKFEDEYNVTLQTAEDGKLVVKPCTDIDRVGITEYHDQIHQDSKAREEKHSKNKSLNVMNCISPETRKKQNASHKRKTKRRHPQRNNNEFHHLKDVIQFGEFAQAPPLLTFKPRGTKKKMGKDLHLMKA